MDSQTIIKVLEIVSRVAGIGGLSIGLILLIFREVIHKNVFPTLTQEQAYKILNRIIILVTLVALTGIGAWIVSEIFISPRNIQYQQQQVHLTQFTVDEDQSIYTIHRYNPQRQIHPDGMITFHPNGSLSAYGKSFSTIEEFEEFSKRLENETNHYMFGWLSRLGLSPKEIPIVIDKNNEEDKKNQMPDYNYPLFRFSITNDSYSQIVLTRVVLKVHMVIPVLAAGESHILESLKTYNIKISSKKGAYSTELIPPVKIAAQDSASFSLRVFPKQNKPNQTGKVLIADISILSNTSELKTSRFMLYFEDSYS